MADDLVIGSETQRFEGVGFLTGIQRLIREAHVGLVDRLSPMGRQIVPLHTRDSPRQTASVRHNYLASDPVIHERQRSPDDVDAFLFLDVNPQADFAAVHHSLRRRKRPVIVLIHDVIPIKHPDMFFPDEVLRFRLYLQQVLNLADHVIVTSDVVGNDLQSLGWRFRAVIHVIRLGSIFRPRRPQTPETDRMSILYVSTVEPRKGHRQLLDAFDLLRREATDIDLTLIGRAGWASGDLFDAILHHPDQGGRLRWIETADDTVLQTVADRCNIGVFPSHDEGFGLFLEEGLTLGLTMVVSDIPVFRERVYDNVYFTDVSAEGIASALTQAHANGWQEPTHPIRTMGDFLDDLADLVVGLTPRTGESQHA